MPFHIEILENIVIIGNREGNGLFQVQRIQFVNPTATRILIGTFDSIIENHLEMEENEHDNEFKEGSYIIEINNMHYSTFKSSLRFNNYLLLLKNKKKSITFSNNYIYCKRKLSIMQTEQKKSSRSEEEIEHHRNKQRVENMSVERKNTHQLSNRVENMSEKRINTHQLSNRVENMSEERINTHQLSNRVEHMTVERVNNHQLSNRVENMSVERVTQHRQIQAIRNAQRAYENLQAQKKAISLYNRTAIVETQMRNRKRLTFDFVWNKECKYCGCFWLSCMSKEECKLCCFDGKLKEKFLLNPIPNVFLTLLLDNVKHFKVSSLYYNTRLSLAITGIDNGGAWIHQFGDHACKLRGRTYHLLPDTSRSSNGINHFTFHASESVSMNGVPLAVENMMNPIFMATISNMLQQYNTYVRDCVQVGNNINNNDEINVTLEELNSRTQVFDVGQFTSDINEGNRVVRYKLKNDVDRFHQKPALSKFTEPLSYVLLFIHGESGWGISTKQICNLGNYLRLRLLRPERNIDGNYIEAWSHDGSRKVRLNRFQLMPQLAQAYLVDQVSRWIDFKLDYEKRRNQNLNNTGNIIVDTEDISENITHNEVKKSFLSSNFHGSPKHLIELSRNAYRIVAEYGCPHVFITVTCNPQWPEILQNILPDQTAYQRTDIADIVFKQKLDALMNNLRSGEYFPIRNNDGTIQKKRTFIYLISVIEFQERGLPHAHIIGKLTHMPDKNDIVGIQKFIDENITAMRYPILDTDSETEKQYKTLVNGVMLHKCYPSKQGGCLHNGRCKRNYNGKEILETTLTNEGFPVYKRMFTSDNKDIKDLYVVPHNKDIVKDIRSHTNVECTGGVFTVKYIYKYLFKGPKKKAFQLHIESPNPIDNSRDEINKYVQGRYLCAGTAAWRVFGFQTFRTTTPSVTVIKISDECEMQELNNKGMKCNMELYLRRPLNANWNLSTYVDFFSQFRIIKDNGNRNTSSAAEETKMETDDDDYNEIEEEDIGTSNNNIIQIPNNANIYKIVRRNATNPDVLCRLEVVAFSAGEKWYLRQIMLHCASTPTSVQHESIKNYMKALKQVNGTEYATYQQAAVARGIVEDAQVCIEIYTDYAGISSEYYLRILFINLMVNGYPAAYIYYNDNYRQFMLNDYVVKQRLSIEQAEAKLLVELQNRLKNDFGRNLDEFGIPMPATILTEYDAECERYNSIEQENILEELMNEHPLTNEQEAAYTDITHAIDTVIEAKMNNTSVEAKLFLIHGGGGTGKSVFAQKIMAYVRKHKQLAIGVASTALVAASHNDNWMTAHSGFYFPVDKDGIYLDEDCDTIEDSNILHCKLYPHEHSQRRDLLQNCTLIAWDEIASNHKIIIESLFKVMDNLPNTVIVGYTDFQQILPIINQNSIKQVILNATLCYSNLWDRFSICSFTKNLRLTTDITNIEDSFKQNEYANLLHAMGRGNELSSNTNYFAETIPPPPEYNDNINDRPIPIDIQNDTHYFRLKNLTISVETHTIEEQINTNVISNVCLEALNKLYSNGFNNANHDEQFIVAATNIRVDFWNNCVQMINPETQIHTFYSRNIVSEIDDPYGHLKELLLNDKVLNELIAYDVPPHILKLKINDICLLYANYSKSDGLTKNTRVRIFSISNNLIGVKKLNSLNSEIIYIPKLRFEYRSSNGKSFKMIRTQFPLRLAYCLSYNRSQGQSANKILIDIVVPPFSHGHTYVAFSRSRRYDGVTIFCSKQQAEYSDNIVSAVIVPSITHKEVLEKIVF